MRSQPTHYGRGSGPRAAFGNAMSLRWRAICRCRGG